MLVYQRVHTRPKKKHSKFSRWTPVERLAQGLQLLLEAIDQAGHKGKILIGSDPASSEFWKEKEQVYVRSPDDGAADDVLWLWVKQKLL